jgi:hypothetical protein
MLGNAFPFDEVDSCLSKPHWSYPERRETTNPIIPPCPNSADSILPVSVGNYKQNFLPEKQET